MKHDNVPHEESTILAFKMLKEAIDEELQPVLFADQQLMERKRKAWRRLKENFQQLFYEHDGDITRIENQEFIDCIETWECKISYGASWQDPQITNKQLMSYHNNAALNYFSFFPSKSELALEKMKKVLYNNANSTLPKMQSSSVT